MRRRLPAETITNAFKTSDFILGTSTTIFPQTQLARCPVAHTLIV
jgi:hypothetical protein